MTYVPYTFSTDFDCIYDKCWKDYLNDLYDVNTKSVSCYVRLRGKPNPAMLRKWYWFDNAIWRINSIKDWNIGSYEPTLVEFIKVQDISNYALTQITKQGRIQIILTSYNLTNSAQTLTGKVICQNPSEHWSFGDVITWEDLGGTTGYTSSPSPSQGTGTTNFSISVPANSGLERTYKIILKDAEDNPIYAYFKQEGDTTPYLAFNDAIIDVGAEGGTINIPFVKQYVNAGLTASTTAAWITNLVVNENNNYVTATIAANDTGNPRTGTTYGGYIVLNGIGRNGAVVNTQTRIDQARGGEVNFQVQPNHMEFHYDSTSGGTLNITYAGNWEITQQDQ